MTFDVTVPASGESVTTANVARWHRQHGESVRKGEVLVTLETDKVSNELEAAADGTLEILVGEGEEVAIGTLIARIAVTEPALQPASAAPAAPPQPSASTELKVPASGESITSANVAAWRRNDGDSVVRGEILVALETDKVTNELEAPVSGVLKILVPEGEEVAIGAVIARIEAATERGLQPASPPVIKPATAAVPKEKASDGHRPTLQISASTAPVVREAPSKPFSDGRTTRRKMSMLRRKIATHLVNAQQTAAILTTFNEVDMSAVMDLRKAVQDQFVKKHGVKLGFMSFFVKAVAQALKDVPSINARIEGNDIIENHFYDIGVAIGTEKGLVVPVLRDCDRKSFACIEQDILDYATKARDGKITIDDLQGGVFSISNGGTYGSLLSTPILNPPQSGILGMHTIQQRPVAVDGQVVIRPMMYLALSYDHRLVDGKEAVTFLIHIKDSLENPARLMLEM
ncbi:MAG: dihydrolipoyllysine-residue succinyltransferase [Verrucomicrobiaceae bacterium]|nr:MAG: dihydrolipoyllysine-residue succinyltransferase [Verrucomicrobiaceae bacterium]